MIFESKNFKYLEHTGIIEYDVIVDGRYYQQKREHVDKKTAFKMLLEGDIKIDLLKE